MMTQHSNWDDYRTEAEYWTVVDTFSGQATVYVAKAGGGTLGREYSGSWYVEIQLNGEVYWEQIETGMPHDHDRVAKLAVELKFD